MDLRLPRGDGRMGRLAATVAAAVLLSLPIAAGAAERVALVIGNSAYHDPDARLRNPGNDADGMAAALGRLGFEVVKGKDLDTDGFDAKIDEFAAAARGADVTLFFYAGHGLQVQGKNWLMPVNAKIEKKRDLERGAVKLDAVMERMGGTKKLVFLDACRNNPLARGLARSMGLSRTEASNRGLARVKGVPGTLVVYATQADDVASDGEGDNSPFTEALLAHIETPVNVFAMIDKVAQSVFEATNEDQIPSIQSSPMGMGSFSLASAAAPPPKDTAASAAGGTPSGDAARVAYEAAKEVDSVVAYQSVVKHFPNTFEADLARAQIAKLEGAKEPLVVAGGDAVEEETPPVADPRNPGDTFRDCPGCPEMVVVPSGSFEMGSPESESGRDDDEGPQHRVTIGRPFAVGVHEVTRGEFGRFVSESGRSMGDSCRVFDGSKWKKRSGMSWKNPGFSQTDSHPVVCVSWSDAKAYVRWLSGKTGETYRLLSEAEWEYVARAGARTARYWGESESGQCRYANGWDETYGWSEAFCDDGHARTSPVGTYEPNGFGLQDVLGNVWEWTEDCWNESYAGAPRDGSAWESGDCGWRVLRGGSWSSTPWLLRSANRIRSATGYRNDNYGFRVARTLTP